MKCIICNKEAVGRYSIDIDIAGLGYCKRHKDKVSGLALWAVIAPELYEQILCEEKNKYHGNSKNIQKHDTGRKVTVGKSDEKARRKRSDVLEKDNSEAGTGKGVYKKRGRVV